VASRTELERAVIHEEDVLRLEVAVDDVPVVDILERERELQEPLHDLLLRHPLVPLLVVLYKAVHVAARAKGHDEAQLVGRLVDEAVLVAANVRVAQPLEQARLLERRLALARLHPL